MELETMAAILGPICVLFTCLLCVCAIVCSRQRSGGSVDTGNGTATSDNGFQGWQSSGGIQNGFHSSSNSRPSLIGGFSSFGGGGLSGGRDKGKNGDDECFRGGFESSTERYHGGGFESSSAGSAVGHAFESMAGGGDVGSRFGSSFDS